MMTAQGAEAGERNARAKELSREITEEHEIVTLEDSGEKLVHDMGVFKENLADAIIKRHVEEAEPEETNNFTREVIGHVERSTLVPASEFDPDPMVINVQNGLFDMRTMELRPHSPLYLSRIQLPANYDPKAAPVRIMRFLKEMLPNPDDVVNVLEDAATTLIRDARFQKAYMYIGAGDNGKSKWLGTLNALLGKANVSNDSIHDLGMGRFGAGNIEGKLAVIYPDIGASEVTVTGKLKAIIAGDRITVERKNVQGRPIEPFCKLFYSANTLPIVNDDSDAWFRRWRITNWTVQVPAERKDPDLLDKLTQPAELSGLFNVLVALARRMIRQKGFTYSATTHQVRREWGDRSNVIKAFVTKCLDVQKEAGPELVAASAEVYAAYVKFCLRENFTPKKQAGFTEDLKTVAVVRSETRRTGSKTARFLVGVGLKSAPGIDTVTGVTTVTGVVSPHTEGDDVSGGGSETRNTVTPVTATEGDDVSGGGSET
jgi:putative DNA primase/helicase